MKYQYIKLDKKELDFVLRLDAADDTVRQAKR